MRLLSAALLLSATAVMAQGEVRIERITVEETAPAKVTGVQHVGSQWFPFYAMAHRLLQGSSVDAHYLPGAGSAAIDAVITMRSITTADAAFSAARGANVRTIEIDAANSLGGRGRISTIPSGAAPAGDGLPPAFWLSLENLTVSADIIARDLTQLLPEHRAGIEKNLSAMRQELSALARQAAQLASEADTVEVADPAERYSYLVQTLGLIAIPPAEDVVSLDALGLSLLLSPSADSASPWDDLLGQMEQNIAQIFQALKAR
jgi:hypothetical protein